MTVKRVPFCESTVNKVVKEKFIFGDVIDGPSPRTRLAQFDKLSLELKDKIRHTVSSVEITIKYFKLATLQSLKGTFSKQNHVWTVSFQIHEHIAKCNDKENDEVIFPTARHMHEKIQEIDGIPKWNFTTSYRILMAMGFRYTQH